MDLSETNGLAHNFQIYQTPFEQFMDFSLQNNIKLKITRFTLEEQPMDTSGVNIEEIKETKIPAKFKKRRTLEST